MSQESKSKKIEEMTQEELEIVMSLFEGIGSMLQQEIEKIFQRLQPLIDNLRVIQAKQEQIKARRVRKI